MFPPSLEVFQSFIVLIQLLRNIHVHLNTHMHIPMSFLVVWFTSFWLFKLDNFTNLSFQMATQRVELVLWSQGVTLGRKRGRKELAAADLQQIK